MRLIFSPAACNARIADSRPEPGPFTKTSTCRIPFSMAFFAAASAARCAANGVLLRDPLNPWLPALAQTTTFPARSVMVMIVLLNDAWTCATPVCTCLRSFFFPTFLLTIEPR